MAGEVLATSLTAEHAKQVAALEGDQLRRTAEVYEKARLEVAGRLAGVSEETFTAQQLRATKAQLDAATLAIMEKMGDHAGTFTAEATGLGIQQMIQQIGYWDEAVYAGSATTAIAHDALQKVITPQNLLLDKYDASVRSYTASMRADTGRRLGKHLAMGSTWREMSLDLAGPLKEASIAGAQWRAERIVRTEMVDALSLGHQAVLEEAVQFIPGLQRQWDSTMDERTSDVCRALHGQIVEIGEPWYHSGEAIMRPPAIPNCRSVVVAYHKAWAEEDAEFEEEAAKRQPKVFDFGDKLDPRGRVGGVDPVRTTKKLPHANFKKAVEDGSYITDGAEIITYTDTDTGALLQVVRFKPGHSQLRDVSVMNLYVPEGGRLQGAATRISQYVQSKHPSLQGQVSKPQAARIAYRNGRRMAGNPAATLDEILAVLAEESSVNLITQEVVTAKAARKSAAAVRKALAADKKSAKEALKLARTNFVEGVAEGADSEALRSGLYDAIERAARFEGLRLEDEAFWVAKRFALYSEEARQFQVSQKVLHAARREARKRPLDIPNARKTKIDTSRSKWTGADGKIVPSRVVEHKAWAKEMRLVDPDALPAARKALKAAEKEMAEVTKRLGDTGLSSKEWRMLQRRRAAAETNLTIAQESVALESAPGRVHYTTVAEGEQKVFLGLGGGPGSGKGTSLRTGQVKTADNMTILNSDDAKMMIGEFKHGAKVRDPRIAPFVHEESSTVLKRAMADAIDNGQHIALDGTGDGGLASVSKKINAVRSKGYRTVGEYSTCTVEEATERAIFREIGSARGVPADVMHNTHRQVSRDFLSFKDLPNFWDELRLWDTSVPFGQPARLVYEKVGGVETIHNKVLWERFKAKANVPDFVRPTKVGRVKTKLHFETIEQEIKELGKAEAASRRAAAHVARLSDMEEAAVQRAAARVATKQAAVEVVRPVPPRDFVPQLEQARKAKRGEFLSPATEKGLADEGATAFLSSDGKVGYALTRDGDFRHAFNWSDQKGVGKKLLKHAKEQADERGIDRITLDAFDGYLTDFYERNGFVEVSRMAWDDAYAPAGWDYAQYGRPDVVNMEYILKPKKPGGLAK